MLVVDDDASAVKTLTEVLKARGYSVTEARGHDLFEKAKMLQPDIIMLSSSDPQARDRPDPALRKGSRERPLLCLPVGVCVSKKILIVDDEVHLRTLLHQTLEELEDEGVELHTATNGEEALAAIESMQPNLVFLDVMMPKLSGFDVCERAKKALGLTNVYIVLLTAKGQEFDRQRGIEVGADLYMTKPFDPDALLMKARDVLGI